MPAKKHKVFVKYIIKNVVFTLYSDQIVNDIITFNANKLKQDSYSLHN